MKHVGLARGTVRLEPYSQNWPTLFKVEAKLLQNALAVNPAAIQHVGSTSIPGMAAKPIIDIAVVVDNLALAETWQDKLAAVGYWYKGAQADMPNRRFFAKGPESKRTVYLHLVNQEEFNRLIQFRNYLTDNKEAAKAYAELKLRLAQSNANDRANYSKLKNDFIREILNR